MQNLYCYYLIFSFAHCCEFYSRIESCNKVREYKSSAGLGKKEDEIVAVKFLKEGLKYKRPKIFVAITSASFFAQPCKGLHPAVLSLCIYCKSSLAIEPAALGKRK